MNLAQLLVRAARSYPERPAVLRGAEVLRNYRQLATRNSQRTRGLLSDSRLGP